MFHRDTLCKNNNIDSIYIKKWYRKVLDSKPHEKIIKFTIIEYGVYIDNHANTIVYNSKVW